jgi:hypothetical protein
MVGVTEGCQVQAGAGGEPVKEAGPVLRPLEPNSGPITLASDKPRTTHVGYQAERMALW